MLTPDEKLHIERTIEQKIAPLKEKIEELTKVILKLAAKQKLPPIRSYYLPDGMSTAMNCLVCGKGKYSHSTTGECPN